MSNITKLSTPADLVAEQVEHIFANNWDNLPLMTDEQKQEVMFNTWTDICNKCRIS